MDENLKVLVVDDSLIYRKMIREAFNGVPGVTVVGSAENGERAIEKIQELTPDLITLDFEMPRLNGLGVLRWLKQNRQTTRAVMVSAVTQEGAAQTVQALQEGAFEFVAKPCGTDPRMNLAELTAALNQHTNTVRFLSRRSGLRPTRLPRVIKPSETSRALRRVAVPVRERRTAPVQAIGIGVSTGGPDALRVMLPELPADLRVPVLIVQHMPPVFTRSLAQSLDQMCPLNVYEAQEGQPVLPGDVLIAPGGKQMRISRCGSDAIVRLTDDPPIRSCKPSVDYLFNSMVDAYGAGTLGVIMTGMGYDGAEGCRRIAQHGGQVIAQDEESCVVYGMPRKPVEEGVANLVMPLNRIGEEIVRIANGRTRP